MLKEYPRVRQVEGEPRRRWFGDDYFDLIVWLDDGDGVVGFQLCYDKGGDERALTWLPERGFTHRRVDDGERGGDLAHKSTPVLVVDGAVDHRSLTELLAEEGREIDQGIVRRICDRLAGYPLAT